MTELQFALECGLSVEVKELVDGSIQAFWKTGNVENIIIMTKSEAIELNLITEEKTEVEEVSSTEQTLEEWIAAFTAKYLVRGEVVKVENKKAQSMLTLKVKDVQWQSPRTVSRLYDRIPWITLENNTTFRLKALKNGSWKVVEL